MFMFKNFFERISSDFRQRELLPLKLLFFVHSSTLFVLYPYLTIHMRELGINVEEAAIMSAVTPIVAIIMPPIAGVIADRIGNFKVILSLFSAMGGLASLLLLLVPVGRIVISFPNMTVLEVSANQSFIEMRVSEPYPCFRNKSETIELFANMQACGVICNRRPEGFTPYERGPRTLEEEKTAILGARSYSVLVRDDSTDAFTYSPRAEDLPVFRSNVKDDVRNSKIMTNKGNFASSIRMLAPNRFFFPTRGLYTWACIADADNITCSIVLDKNGPTSGARFISKAYAVKLDNVHSEGEEGSIFRSFRILEMRPSFGNHSSWNYLPVASASPGNESVLVIDVPLPSRDNGLEVDATLELNDCSPKCIATVPRSAICTNKDSVSEFDISLTFWMYLSIRVFIGMISGTAFAMFEGAVIAILREHKADYGLQRIYATIGGMISSPLSGYLIDYASRNKLYTDFRPAFYLYAGLKILSAGLMLTINLEFKSPATNVLADVVTVLKKIEIVALFITCFILGTAWGYIESFLFWLLQDLGASRSLMGITITVGGIAGLPLLVMSGPIIDRIGHANVLFIGFVFYAIRLLGYSLIYNPWMCLIFEAMESVTSSLSFTAAVTYAAKLSTTTTDSSIQGLLGGLYFGVGKGAGSLIGGYLMQYVGTRPTYQIFAAVTLITGCLYFLFNYFYIERHPDRLAKGSTTEVKWNEKPKQPEKPCETKPPLNPSPSVNHNSSRKWKNAAAATNTTTTTNASVKSPDATLDLSAGMVNNVIKNKTNYGAVNGAFDKADEIIAADTTTSPVEVKVVGESERR